MLQCRVCKACIRICVFPLCASWAHDAHLWSCTACGLDIEMGNGKGTLMCTCVAVYCAEGRLGRPVLEWNPLLTGTSSAPSEKSSELKSPKWSVPECVVVRSWSIWSGSVVLAPGRLHSSMRTALASLKYPILTKSICHARKMCFLSRTQFTKCLATAVNMPFCKPGAERYLEP